MPTYRARLGDKIISIEAESPERAALQARLRFVGQGRADEVAAEANQRGQAALQGDEAYPRMSVPKLEHFSPDTPEGLINLGLGGASMAAAAPGAALGLVKDTAIYGAAEGAEKLLGLPSWTGEAIGAISPVKSLGKLLLGGALGGAKRSVPAVAAEGAEALASKEAAKTAEREAARATAEKMAERKLELEARKVAIREAEGAARIKAIEERTRAQVAAMQERAARVGAPRTAPKAGPRAVPKTEGATALKPEPEMIPDEAVSLVAEPLPFKPRGTVKPATNLGGPAKPGPAPTPEVDLEDVLRRSIEAAKAKKAGLAESALKGPRIQEGAQRVGKAAGMTKEEVRTATGPLLGEKLGEASPIIPKEPWARIVETMKALPKTGGQREAYVARAAPGKNRGQMEQLRRTLEELGLLLPIGAGGVALSD